MKPTPNRIFVDLVWVLWYSNLMSHFIGRNRELAELQELLTKKSASLVVIRGRRRIGKSRLALEFSQSFEHAYIFSGLPPTEGITAKIQREEMRRQVQEQRIPSFGGDDWGDIFYDLAQKSKQGKVLIVLDEITWMGNKDPTFLGKLKNAWDLHFKNNPDLILIISGSNSYWIEKNILSSTGFLGRVSYRLVLDELPLNECSQFWNGHISTYEKFKVLAVTGGIPRYLEEIKPELSAEENIKRLCYQPGGILFNEFEEIFSDLFSRKAQKYKTIIQRLADGKASVVEIAKSLEREKGGDLVESLQDLMEAGFVSRDYSWSIKSGQRSKINQYRLKDNYVHFYLKYIEPYRQEIQEGVFTGLPAGWLSIMGYQFENLVINNRKKLFSLLSIPLDDIVCASPFLQTQTQQHAKCQVDLLIQTRFNTLYVCEIKFERGEIGQGIIKEMKERMEKLYVPKGFSARPVLIHVNGVTDALLDVGYFSNIIDFGQLIKASDS